MIGILVVTHGSFGQELLKTSEDIVGRQGHAIGLAVTSDTGPEKLAQGLQDAWTQIQSPEGTLFLTDMMGGSPSNAVLYAIKNEAKAELITGVNLYMLLSAFTHRSSMDLSALVRKVSEDGKRAIVVPKDLLLKRKV